ncbi:DUF3319 domain-containing protein [Parasalinivibrio latis]|uniref:DUF3319 domain-containing protein n=1 Tax=Parasalinivibrio latis TaxID=2952610 RepID=UPI0030DE1119
MTKRLYHRGYNIEYLDSGEYAARLGGNRVVTAELLAIKKSIDWWAEASIFRDPADFEGMEEESEDTTQTEEHKEYKLVNDDGRVDTWYVMIGGKLFKGSLKMLKRKIDLEVFRQKREEGETPALKAKPDDSQAQNSP